MSKPNKHGLRRLGSSTEDEAIKRQIREESGYGCVICGLIPYDYEHIEPEFSDAHSHDPNYMTLLCGGCHDQVTRGWIPKSEVWKAKNNPRCLQTGYNSQMLWPGNAIPDLMIGDTLFEDCPNPILVAGEPVITFGYPEEGDNKISITGNFYDSSGEKIAAITNNEWRGLTTDADINVRTVGGCPTITITSLGEDIFELALDLPHNRITISKLKLMYMGNRVEILDSGRYGKDILIMGRQEGGQGAGFQWRPGFVKGIESLTLDSVYTLKEKYPGSMKFKANEKYIIKESKGVGDKC